MTTEESTETFTEQEFQVIFAVCMGGSYEQAADERCGIAVDSVRHHLISIFDKANISSRLELYDFVKAALNRELRDRRSHEPW